MNVGGFTSCEDNDDFGIKPSLKEKRMTKQIIAIAGKKAAGKDLLGKYLMVDGFKRFAFGDIIRERVIRDFGLSAEQVYGTLKEAVDTRWNTTPRVIMEKYGMFFRKFDAQYWIKQLGKLIEESDADKIVVTDVRLIAEVDFLKSLGAKVIRLERYAEHRQRIYPGPESTAITEIELDDFKGFDIVLPPEKNQVPEDLEEFAGRIL